MSRIEKEKKTIFNVHRPLHANHKNRSSSNKPKDRSLFAVQSFEHKRVFCKKGPRCLSQPQLHSRQNHKKISNSQQKIEKDMQMKNEILDCESKEDSSMDSIPYLETIFLGENEPSYLKIFAINGDEALKLNLELGRFFFFSQGPLDFDSVSLVVLTVCNYLKCDSVKEIFISYGCITSAGYPKKDEKFSQELIKLVEDIIERQQPAKSPYFSKQLLAYSYFLVQYVWQICILCMGVGLQEENQSVTEKQEENKSLIEQQGEQNLDDILSKDEQDSDDGQECENDSSIEKQTSNESPASKSSSAFSKGAWRADKRSWEEIPMELLLSEELLTLLNLRYQQLYNDNQDSKLTQKNQESEETSIDQDTLIGYVRCILKVRDSTFDYKKIHSLPLPIRNLVKTILKHPINLIKTLIPAKLQLSSFSFEQFSKILLLITESSIFIGFTLFAKQIEW